MMTAPVTDLLARAVTRGLLSSRAATQAEVLMELGLHPEQALIGTRVLTPEEYVLLRNEQSDAVVERLPSDAAPFQDGVFPRGWLAENQACVVRHTRHGIVLACAEPSTELHEDAARHALAEGKQIEMVPLLVSDVRRVHRARHVRAQAKALLRRVLTWAEWAEVDALRIVPHADQLAVVFHAHDVVTPSLMLPVGVGAALAIVARRMPGWEADITRVATGWTVEMHRTDQSEQGLEQVHAWTAFQKQPSGMLVFVNPPTSASRSVLRKYPVLMDADRDEGIRTAVDTLHASHDLEAAFHRALGGDPTVLLTSQEPEELVDWRASGIPVRVIHATPTPEGYAWSST